MNTIWLDRDTQFMEMALRLAAAQLGKTGENPAVGCVIVRGDEVVGCGATADGGRPHAEAVALADAGMSALGATVYVTLEPCAHISIRGESCTKLLLDAQISRLICCIEDPDPRTSGQGFMRLRDAGISVEIGLLDSAGREQIATFTPRLER